VELCGNREKGKRLLLAQKRIAEIQQEIEQHYQDYRVTPNMIELRNIALVASLIIMASLKRKESRGLHYIIDYPEKERAAESGIFLKGGGCGRAGGDQGAKQKISS